MGSEQSSQLTHKKATTRAPPIRRGHTISASNRPETSRSNEPTASGNDSPCASVCSDTELPYISYTVNRPIGDSPKTSKARRGAGPAGAGSGVRRQTLGSQGSQGSRRRAHDIVVVSQPACDTAIDDDIRRLQEIPTFLPIMRGTLGLTSQTQSARDAAAQCALDGGALCRLVSRHQAHVAACAHALHAAHAALPAKLRETDTDIFRLHAQFVERQRSNARNAERLSRVREMSHQLSRCHSLLNQTLKDIDELNNLLPEDKRLEPFVWNT